MKNNNVISFIVLMAPAIAMISGLFMAPLICTLVILIIWTLRTQIYKNDFFNLPKIEIVIVGFALISCLWSIDIRSSLLHSIQLGCILVICHILYAKSHLIKISSDKLFLSLILACIVFYIEIYTNGFIIKSILYLINSKPNYIFSRTALDRGCAILALTSWVVIYHLIINMRYVLAGISYITALSTLAFSDSTGSFVGFILASIGFLMLVLSKMKLTVLIKIAMIVYIILMPIAAKIIDPNLIAKEYGEKLPISYTHRILIWNFVANKSLDHCIIGHGIGVSKFIPVHENDMFRYNKNDAVQYLDVLLSPLPLHPHNNVMQIFLELGVTGLILLGTYVWLLFSKIELIATTQQNILWGTVAVSILINYFFIGMVSFNMWQSWWLITPILIIFLLHINSTNSNHNSL